MQNALAFQALLKNGFLVAMYANANPSASSADSTNITTAAIDNTLITFSIITS